MITALLVGGAVAALGVGIWVGVGAPGVPHQPQYQRKHTQLRGLNPIAWGRTSSRERQRPKSADERRGPRLR